MCPPSLGAFGGDTQTNMRVGFLKRLVSTEGGWGDHVADDLAACCKDLYGHVQCDDTVTCIWSVPVAADTE